MSIYTNWSFEAQGKAELGLISKTQDVPLSSLFLPPLEIVPLHQHAVTLLSRP